MVSTFARDTRAHQAATRLPPSTVVSELSDVLGQSLVAVIAGVNDVKGVGEWARATRRPAQEALDRLRTAHWVLGILRSREDAETIKAWFRGMNPLLEDKSPARVLGEDPEAVIAAARLFAVS